MNIRSQKGEATFETIIAIFIAVILMFIVPLITLADKNDETSQILVQSETDSFVYNIAKTGTVTQEELSTFQQTLNSTGTTYDIELEFKILDENVSKKTAQGNTEVIGENVYYIVYTSAIEQQLNNTDTSNKYTLKEGDVITVIVRNSSPTFAQSLKSIFYKIIGNDAYLIYGSSTAMVTKNGNN